MYVVHAAALLFHANVVKRCEAHKIAVQVSHRYSQHMLCGAVAVRYNISAVKLDNMAGDKALFGFVALVQRFV